MLADNAALRQSIGWDDVQKIWRRLDTGDPAGIGCPMCGRVMRARDVDGVMLDGCPDHDVIWFDGAEITRFRTGLQPAETNRMIRFLDGLP